MYVLTNPYISREAAGEVGSALHGGIAKSSAPDWDLRFMVPGGFEYRVQGEKFRLEGACCIVGQAGLLALHKVSEHVGIFEHFGAYQ